MPKKRRKSRGRRYSDCAPSPLMAPCAEADARARRFSGGSIGPVASGFDHYGYPIVRNFNLPAPFRMAEGRRYGQVQSAIKPMRLVAVPMGGSAPKPKPGIAKVDKFKLKPSPTVPAAPGDLPSRFKFCVQKGEHGYFYRFRNAKTSLHGAEADVVDCKPDESTGMVMCMVNMPGTNRPIAAPLCEEPGADKELVPQDCCVRILGDESGQLVCPGSAYDLLVVKIVTFANVGGIQIASVEHPDLPGGGVRLPVCEPIDEEPDERPCCIEEETGLIVCPQGMEFPLAGKRVPLEYLEFADNVDGMRVARLRCGDISEIPPSERAADSTLDAMYQVCEELGGYIFPVCTQKPPSKRPPKRRPKPPKTTPRPIPPPPKFPDICCYDPATGTLVCEGTPYHGLAVEVVTEAVVGGKPIVSVAHSSIPGGGARVPLCPPPRDIPRVPPADCCVVESSAGLTLMCDPTDHPWNGKNVTNFGQCIDTPNGRVCVLNWEDEYGTHTIEVPICPPPPEKIPKPNGDIPPAPEPVPVPVPPRQPKLPPPTRPPSEGCESVEASHCRQRWDEMVKKPAKLTKCDKKWLAVLKRLRSGHACPTVGRRASSLKMNGKGKPRKYGMGISPEHREYARYPGLRGGRRMI